MRVISFVPALLLVAACSTEERPTMNPGVDCVRCHTQAEGVALPSAPDAPGQQATDLVFTAAGTLYPSPDSTAATGVSGVHVLIRSALTSDAGLELVTNAAGNFYTAEPLDPSAGLTVELVYQGQTVAMVTHPSPTLEYGATTPLVGVGCNGCHAYPSAPNPAPAIGPAPSCPSLPDGGRLDATAGSACGGGSLCCSGICVDGSCSATLGEVGHGCTSATDCRLGYCEGGLCSGAPGRISIPTGLE